MTRKVKVKVLLASPLLLPSLSSATPSSASHQHLLFTLFCLETAIMQNMIFDSVFEVDSVLENKSDF